MAKSVTINPKECAQDFANSAGCGVRWEILGSSKRLGNEFLLTSSSFAEKIILLMLLNPSLENLPNHANIHNVIASRNNKIPLPDLLL